jgi:hypothetical protein
VIGRLIWDTATDFDAKQRKFAQGSRAVRETSSLRVIAFRYDKEDDKVVLFIINGEGGVPYGIPPAGG